MDPLTHALFWSLALNTAAFCLGSLLTFPGPVERLQGAAFVNVFEGGAGRGHWSRGQAEPEALLTMAQRILGEEAALALFQAAAREQGKEGFLPEPTPAFLDRLEARLSGSVGAATAHAMISQLVGRATVTVEDLMAVASESAQIMEYSAKLEAREAELTRTAGALREANEKLMQLSLQKDAFLSQISHELRTPMTSIRAFSEILTEGDLPPETVVKYGRIIHDEAKRLTRLLDDLLDLSVLENGTVQLSLSLAILARDDRHRADGRPPDPARAQLHRAPRPAVRGDLHPHRCRPADAGVHQPDLERAEVLRRGPARVAHRGAPAGRAGDDRLHRQRQRAFRRTARR